MITENISCRVCNGKSGYLQSGKIFGCKVKYYECSMCDYVQTETPFWLDEAYSQPINFSDTGIVVRNNSNVANVLATLFLLKMRKRGVHVDFAGGYGLLTRMLRDIGIESYWSDPYTENLVARGFEYKNQKSDLVTAFETFEHLEHPLKEFEALMGIAPNILISTELVPSPPPKIDDWWYYATQHGQHIGFLSPRSLQFIAQKYEKYLISDGKSLHLFTDIKLSRNKWMLYRRLLKFFPAVASVGLKSLTWEDHLKMRSFDEKNFE